MTGCSGIGECRRSCHDFKFTQNVIKLFCPTLTVKFILRQKHRHTHKKMLGELYRTAFFVFQKIPVVECLDTQISELQIPLRFNISI